MCADVRAYSNAHFGAGSGPIFLDDVQCTSSSSQLLECPSRPILSHNCRHVYDAGVGCDGNLFKQSTGARKHTYVYRNTYVILETQNLYILEFGITICNWCVIDTTVQHFYYHAFLNLYYNTITNVSCNTNLLL